MTDWTLLTITPVAPYTGLSLPPYAARDIIQTLDVFSFGGDDAFGDTVQMSGNGRLLDLSQPQFNLLQTDITCTDVSAPALNSAWRGALVQICCTAERTVQPGNTPDRPIVPGSTPYTDISGFVHFLPSLLMRIVLIKNSFAERKADYSWRLRAIETRAP